MTVIVSLGLLITVLILVFIVRVAADVRAIREEVLPGMRSDFARANFASGKNVNGITFDEHVGHGRAATSLGCFLIWEWRNGDWIVRDMPIGADPGLPPSYPGAFDGDIAKTWVASSQR